MDLNADNGEEVAVQNVYLKKNLTETVFQRAQGKSLSDGKSKHGTDAKTKPKDQIYRNADRAQHKQVNKAQLRHTFNVYQRT